MEDSNQRSLTLCPQCGEPLEAQFEGCWRCAESSAVHGEARIHLTTYPRDVPQFTVLLLGVAVALASIPYSRWFFILMFRGARRESVFLVVVPLLAALFAGFIYAGRRGHIGLERLLFSGLFLSLALLAELLVMAALQTY